MVNDRYAVVDVETTGFSPAVDRIVEIACVLIDQDRVVGQWSTLVNPGIPIPPRATQVHGIGDGAVVSAPGIELAEASLRRQCRSRLPVAHNASFDMSFLRWPSEGAICTLKLARALVPEAPDYKNQTLRRVLKIDRVLADLGAHRALDDALVTAHVLLACRRRFDLRFPRRSWHAFLNEVAALRVMPPRGKAS
jgi:DNA polymerase III epsilon subunit-like protein